MRKKYWKRIEKLEGRISSISDRVKHLRTKFNQSQCPHDQFEYVEIYDTFSCSGHTRKDVKKRCKRCGKDFGFITQLEKQKEEVLALQKEVKERKEKIKILEAKEKEEEDER